MWSKPIWPEAAQGWSSFSKQQLSSKNILKFIPLLTTERVWAEYAGPASPSSGRRIAEKQAGRRAEGRQIQREKGSDRRGNGLEEGQEVVSRPGKASSPGSQHSYKGLRTHCLKSTAQWPYGCGSRNLCRWPTQWVSWASSLLKGQTTAVCLKDIWPTANPQAGYIKSHGLFRPSKIL